MKKLLFTFFGLILLGSTCLWGSSPIDVTLSNIMTAGKTYQNFNLDDNISVVTFGKNNKNVNMNGLFTSDRWYVYQDSPDNGEFTVKAADGYILKSVTVYYSIASSGVLYRKSTSASVASGTAINNINAKSIAFYIGASSGSTGIVRVTQFKVTYEPKLEYVTSNVTIGLSNKDYVHPLYNYTGEKISFKSSNPNIAEVNSSTGAITPKADGGPVTITATGSKSTATYSLTIDKSVYVETFKNMPEGDDWHSTNPFAKFNGDNGIHEWTVRNGRRIANDTIMGDKGIEVKYHGSAYIYESALEGGIKHLSFLWRATTDTLPVDFRVDESVNTTPPVEYRVTKAKGKANVVPQLYSMDIDFKSNTPLRFKMLTTGTSNVVVGPWTITPYLLFTNKAVTATNGFYTVNDNDLINNTGATLTNANISVDKTEYATVDDNGTIRSQQDNKTVKVTATWGSITTTTTLTTKLVNPTITYTNSVITTTIGAADFNNDPVANSGGTITYESGNTDVATVNKNTGLIHIVNGGTAKIIAHVAAAAPYLAKDTFFTLDVNHTPTEKFFEEKFDSIALETTKEGPDEVNGNGAVYRWSLKNYQRLSTSDKIGDLQGVRIKHTTADDGCWIKTVEPTEGGIKEVAFDWFAAGYNNPVHFFVKVGEKTQEYSRVAVGKKNEIMHYAYQFNEASNAGLSIYQTKKETPEQTNVVVFPIKIVPYLLYTRKDTTIKAIDYVGKELVFENKELINNTDNVGVTYSIVDADNKKDIAIIEDKNSGVVTIKGGGDVTVQAKWGNVTTTYKIHITKETPTSISGFYNSNIDILFQTYAPNPVAKIGETTIENPQFTYTIEDEKIVTRDDKGNFILKRTGKTNITCTLVEGPTYSSISLKKWIDVKEPNAEKSWKETFSSLGEKTAFQGKIEIQGDKDVYPWQIRNYRRDFTNDLVNGEKGIQLRYGDADGNNYIAFNGSKEMGGVKGYFFNWRIPEATERAEAKFSVRIQGSFDSTCVYQNVAAGEYFSCAKMINHTTDGMFRIGIPVANDNIVFGPITIVPYLLYSKRDTTIDAKEYESASWKFKQDLAIDNTESGTIVYSLENEAKVANIATINSESGEVTIQGGGTVKVLATWNNISTSYNLTINMEETSVSFEEDAHTVRASEGSYTQTATKTGSSPESVVYSFEGDHKPSTTIDSENGTVSFSATDTVVVMATIAKHLPYPEDTARYTLYITSLDVPQIGFTDETKTLNMNESGYKNVLTTSVGVGDTTYTSSNERVAKVAADGTITVWGKGTTTITARVEETSTFAAAEASYELTIEEATDRAIEETFENDDSWQNAVTTVTTIVGKQFDWSTNFTRHRKNGDALVSGERAVWFNNSGNAYLESAAAIEGGIKRVAFNWNKATVANPKFTVIVGDTTDVVDVAETSVDDSFCQNFFVKKNASLRINNNSGSILLVGTINITPYLLFKGDKVMNIDLDEVTSFNLNDTLINNTQGEGTINFEVDSYTTDVEPTISNGEIDLSKITKGGQVNISAKWNEVTTTLVINTTIKPVVSFAEPTPAAQDLISGSYTNVLNPMEGLGTITYESSNTNVAIVDKNTGEVTFLIAGNTTITAKVAASDIYNKTEKSYDLTINGYTPTEGKSWTETFNSFALETSGSYISSTDVVGDSSVYNWKVLSYHRQKNDTILKEYGTRINANGSINSVDMEGGIKYLAFNWRPKNTADAIDFTVKVGENEYHYSSAKSSAKSIRYERFVNAKQNTTLTLKLHDWESGKAYICFGNITIVPYLLYTTKSHTMNMNAGATYKNESLIDNRDDDTAIKFESGDKTIATVATDGTVTALKAGKVTITATWGKVSTTYELTIEAKTTITLKDNNGTENQTVIENAVGALMPKVALPTKEGYQFNAYWIDEECKAKRFTVTMISKSNTDSTGWVANITYPEDGGVSYTGSGRKWAYNGAELTLYAQYKQERTITLDDQGATKTGTNKVVTAYCPNNNTVNLMQHIEVPEKDNSTFLGYFTGATDGTQLIDATGAFIENVAGYIDTEKNNKKWIYDKDITLYAHWKDSVVVTGETPASDIPANADLTVTQTGVVNMGENTLTVTNLVISATMGGTGTSGQITGATNKNLTVTGDVFFDLTIDKSAPGKQPKDQWHAFTVPFQVSATEGVFNASNGNKLTNGKDYAFRVYNGEKRASGQNGWENYSGTLQPGIFYVITINGDVPTFRFKKVNDAPIVTDSKKMSVYNYGGSGGNYGWNGIGNSQLDSRYVNDKVQVLDPASYTYKPYVAGDKAQFSVGTPFFYQATTDGEIELATEVPASVAARAMSAEPKEIAIKLIDDNFTDRLFISSTEGATNEYQIGRDLSKMLMTNTPAVPQIFAKAYNTKLCIIDAPMAGDEARYDLSLYAPKAGEYTLAAAPVVGYEIFLTMNGDVIWNLSKDNYIIDLEKGTSEAYGLILKVAQTPTDITTIGETKHGETQKFIYDNRLIIIRDGKVYNGAGALVK